MSEYFDRKAEANEWAAKVKRPGHIAVKSSDTVRTLLERYADERSSKKAGEKWERLRIALICRGELGEVPLSELSAKHLSSWRDRRLLQVSPGSVARELTLLSAAFNVGVREWEILQANPISQIKRPPKPQARDKTYTPEQIERVLYCCGDDHTTVTGRVGLAFMFAIQTAMRAGEIAALKWSNVDVANRFVFIESGKTQSARRQVPLTAQALQILERLPRVADTAFDLTSAQLDALFRKMTKRAGLTDMTFHDTRHTAATWMADKLSVMELAKVMGIRDLRVLQNVYYNPKISDLADRLTAPQPLRPPNQPILQR